MIQHNSAPIQIILVVVSLVFFGFAGFAWPVPVEPYRVRLIGAGLFFLVLSSFF